MLFGELTSRTVCHRVPFPLWSTDSPCRPGQIGAPASRRNMAPEKPRGGRPSRPPALPVRLEAARRVRARSMSPCAWSIVTLLAPGCAATLQRAPPVCAAPTGPTTCPTGPVLRPARPSATPAGLPDPKRPWKLRPRRRARRRHRGGNDRGTVLRPRVRVGYHRSDAGRTDAQHHGPGGDPCDNPAVHRSSPCVRKPVLAGPASSAGPRSVISKEDERRMNGPGPQPVKEMMLPLHPTPPPAVPWPAGRCTVSSRSRRPRRGQL